MFCPDTLLSETVNKDSRLSQRFIETAPLRDSLNETSNKVRLDIAESLRHR